VLVQSSIDHPKIKIKIFRRWHYQSATPTEIALPNMIRMIPTRLVRSFPFYSAQYRAASSLSLLKDLRARTGAPIVECQKAIAACPDVKEDDLTPILDWLRLHSSAKVSAKVAGRTTNEGLVGFYSTPDAAVLVQVAAETDFAAHSEPFRQFLRAVLPTVCHAPPDIPLDDPEALLRLPLVEGPADRTLQDALQEAQLAIRENLGLAHVRRWRRSDHPHGTYHAYVHNRVEADDGTMLLGTAAAGVVLRGAPEPMEAVGKLLAMHIVAAKPLYAGVDAIPDAVRNKERDLITHQCQDAKKPPAIVEKMIQGRMQKWYESVCLLEQAHMIQEGNPKIRTFLEQQNVTLQEYHYLSIGM
jgi:elongation factor Ts